MNIRVLLSIVALLAAVGGHQTQAATLSIVQNPNSAYDHGLTGNSLVGSVEGYWGANLRLDGKGVVNFQFVGSRAYWDSAFLTPGGTFFNHGTPVNSTMAVESDNGWVPFAFLMLSGNTAGQSAWNGFNNTPDTSKPLFFLAKLDNGLFYIGLNDDGLKRNGAQIMRGQFDADGDDLGVYASVSEVPLPGTMGLLGLGLAGLGALRRRKA